ncbi:MAG: SCO family protein [Polaromonas sp.]|nr:SCO family protein [Polaromonas sp.]
MPLVASRRCAVQSIAGAVALALSTVFLQACSPDKPQFKSVDLTGADYASGFSLSDQNGQTRTLKDFAGKIVVVFFGFTQCPDVCPTTMTELAQVKKLLGPDGEKLQAVFITVDPERDTAELLKAYMGNFDSSFIALRPTLAELPELAKDFKVFYKKAEGKTPGSYSMDHSAGSYIFDAKGRIRLYTRYGSGTENLVSDIRLLLKNS